jgi:hypothetical protein
MPGALAAGFTDIDDAALSLSAETLRMLGVINGVGGDKFDPGGHLTRAAFCKMTVLIQNKGDTADSYMNRTIFPDVKSNHWARGYINLMASSATPLLRGFSDGTFRPDTDVSFAQAVTILMRALGYADADTDMQWPDGYIKLARQQGLLEGLDGIAADGALTRAQAVTLFVNLLNTKQKAGTEYITTLGTEKKAILFRYEDETLYTSAGEFKTAVDIPSGFFGREDTLVLNADGKVITCLADGKMTSKALVMEQIQAAWLVGNDGKKYAVETDTRLLVDGKEQTYGTYWVNLTKGSGAVLYFGEDGKLDIIYCTSPSKGTLKVLKSTAPQSELYALTGGADYTAVKNGKAATAADARTYDVASYDAAAKVLTLTDNKLTGCYEYASPNTASPETITVLGNKFEVLDSALNDLSSFKIGEEITVLLSADGKVAGVLPVSVYKAEAVGILSSYSGGTASIKLINGLTVTGKAYYVDSSLVGELVIVRTYYGSNGLTMSVSKLGGSEQAYSLDTAARKLGSLKLDANVAVFEKVGDGKPQQIDYEDITQKSVQASKIYGLHIGGDGEVDVLYLNNVTGDLYTYGFVSTGTVTDDNNTPDDKSDDKKTNYITLKNAAGTVSYTTRYSYSYKDKVAGGVSVYNTEQNLAVMIELTKAAAISRSAFTVTDEGTTVELPGFVMPVSDKVVCYNAQNGAWFASLDEARAFSDRLTVYYDRIPTEGGKVRLIVVE